MSAFVLNKNYELQLPNSFVEVDREEMEYIDGGWSMGEVLHNVTKLIACFSLGYVGSALRAFAAANQGLGYGQFLLKAGAAVWNFIKCAPWQVQLACGVSLAATVYAIGTWDL